MFLGVVFNLNSFTVFTLRWGIVKCGEDFDRCLALKNLVQGDVFIFNSNQFCSMIELSHMILSNDGLVALHYKSYGIFCVHPKRRTNSPKQALSEVIRDCHDFLII